MNPKELRKLAREVIAKELQDPTKLSFMDEKPSYLALEVLRFLRLPVVQSDEE